jgi:hypothetical protein
MHLVDDGKKDSRVQGVQGSSEIQKVFRLKAVSLKTESKKPIA